MIILKKSHFIYPCCWPLFIAKNWFSQIFPPSGGSPYQSLFLRIKKDAEIGLQKCTVVYGLLECKMYTLQLFMDHLWNYKARLEVHDSVPWETLPTIWNHLELVPSEVSRQSEDFPIWDPKISLFWQNKEVISSSLLESLSGCSCSWNIKDLVKEMAKKVILEASWQ